MEKIGRVARDKRISCAEALELARKEGVPSGDLGELLTEMGVKIVDCQLGCFPRETPCSGAASKKAKI